ncbi:CpsD/CapB family tyrosine-protein kinase [Ectobacillus funiculus]|uniref:CpsD/CapB family tyrosine-protein kinase n=1 Tax=Ectobacillus funiculus TaxID=137993 RepID=UPI00397A1EB6
MIRESRKRPDVAKEESLVTYNAPNSKISEQYRVIRTNLQFTSANRKKRTIVITSPNLGEGKSTTTTNLAVSIAQQGEKVLIIDADLRNPAIHTIFKLENTIGLTSILIGQATLDGAVNQTEIGRVDVLTSGPVPFNPAELLGSAAMETLISKAMERYDVILFDSSPLLELTDTSILANQCDGVILVLSCNRTKNEDTLAAKRILSFTRAELIGAILNNKV